MRLRRLAIPLMAVLTIVAIGAATTIALVAAWAQQPVAVPQEPIPPAQAGKTDTPRPVPTEVISFETPPKTALDPSSLPEPKPAAEDTDSPTPVPTVVISFETPPKAVLDPASLPEPKPAAEDTDTPTPVPTVVISFETPPKTALDPASLPEPKPAAEDHDAKPMPKPTLDLGVKGNRIPPGPVQESSSQPVSKAADSSGKDAVDGNVYTWRDGNRTMRAVLQEDLVAQSKSDNTPQDVIIAEGGGGSIVRKQYKHGSAAQPVFKSELGGGLMTLPGGVMLALDPEWDPTAVDKFFETNGIKPDQVSELSFLDNAFFVETDPGFPSLELANSLADKDGVAVSSPNWWRQLETK